jgi:simple sugar transport system permease protein
MTQTSPTSPAAAAATRYTELTRWRRITRSSAANITVLYGLLVLGLALATLFAPGELNFFSEGNLAVLSQQVPIIAILAIGAGILMIAGEFDLSLAGMSTLAAYLLSLAVSRWGLGLFPGLLIALAAAVAVGLVNSFVTLRLGVPSFVATLGMMFTLRGIVRWVSIDPKTGQPGQITFAAGDGFKNVLSGQVAGPLHAQALWLILVAAFAVLLLNRHFLGNHIFAVGGDRDAAQKSGINVAVAKVTAFVLCAVMAAFAGIVQTARIGMVDPAQTLTGLELEAIASAVIGGVYLFGGRGSVLGMVLGAALLVTIENVLVLLRFPGEYMPVFVGSMVIISVIINTNFGARFSAPRRSL